MGLNPFIMLKAIQRAHFQQGQQVELPETLADIAELQGLNKKIWKKKMQQTRSDVVETVQASHQLMNQYQVQGYPALIAATANGLQRLPHTL